MGIKRLYKSLRCCFQEKEIVYLKGKKIGIDAMGLLYKAFFYHSDLEIITTELKLSIIRNLENKLNILKKNKIQYIFIIDGKVLQCKQSTNLKRENKRKNYLKKSKTLQNSKHFDIGQNSLFKKYSKKLPKAIIHFFIDYLIFKKINFQISPYEADSQLIYMYNKNQIDYIMSEDSDIAIYGCLHIVKGMDKRGNCFIVDKKILGDLKKENDLKKKKNKRDLKIEKGIKFFFMELEQKIEFGVFCGCDYLGNIKGVGFNKILDFFPAFGKEFRKMLEVKIGKFEKNGEDIFPEDLEVRTVKGYFECFEYAKASFLNMIVYCEKKNKLVNLRKLKRFYDFDDSILKKFIGDEKEFEGFEILDFVEGKVDLVTFGKRKLIHFDFEKYLDFIYSSIDNSNKLLNNLSSVTYKFSNFKELQYENLNKKKMKLE